MDTNTLIPTADQARWEGFGGPLTNTLISEAARLAKTAWEKRFTAYQAARLERWGGVILSEEQRAVLEKIVITGLLHEQWVSA